MTSCYEPKWDGFRALVFRGGDDVYIQSRDLKPLDRYFPELHDGLMAALPDGCVVDGEIVIATPHGLDFDRLQLRLHPAASRAAKLATETPAEFVAFDLLAAGGADLRSLPFDKRREQLEKLLRKAGPPVHLTPMTRDRDVAVEWLERFEGGPRRRHGQARGRGACEPARVMFKIKHSRGRLRRPASAGTRRDRAR